jgi:UPF0042 nucleotide-binding protein
MTNAIRILSFGYLHSQPPKADLIIDLRELLSDPAHRPEGDMLDMTGLDKEVVDFVFATPGTYPLIHSAFNIVVLAAQLKPITIAIGCAGGRHRSVAFSEGLKGLLETAGIDAIIEHMHVHLPRVIRNQNK